MNDFPYITALIGPMDSKWQYQYYDWDNRKQRVFKVSLNFSAFKNEVKRKGMKIVDRNLSDKDVLTLKFMSAGNDQSSLF